MIRDLNLNDINCLNRLIHDNNYIVNEYELKKNAKVYIESDNQIVGFISYSNFYERVELNYIFVSEQYRKRHIASKLMENMIEECKEKQVKTIDLEVNAQNEKAINLYNKYDFRIINVRRKYYNGVDAYIMLKEIR